MRLDNMVPCIVLDLTLYAAFIVALVLLVGSRNDRHG